MKKFLSFLTAFVLLLCVSVVSVAFVGCGKSKESALTASEAKEIFDKAVNNMIADVGYNITADGDMVYGATRTNLVCKKVDDVVCYAQLYYEPEDGVIYSYYGNYFGELLKLSNDESYVYTFTLFDGIGEEYNIGTPNAEEKWSRYITGGTANDKQTQINAKAIIDDTTYEIQFTIERGLIVSAIQTIHQSGSLLGTIEYEYKYSSFDTSLVDNFDYPNASEILTWEDETY